MTDYNVTQIDGTVLSTQEESEPWEYHTTLTEKEVTGWLHSAVLARVGKATGRVTSLEDNTSTGTCEICGGESFSIKIFVDGESVVEFYDAARMDGTPNTFSLLNNWLNEEKSA